MIKPGVSPQTTDVCRANAKDRGALLKVEGPRPRRELTLLSRRSEEPIVQPGKPGGNQQKAAQSADQHSEPEPNGTHRGRARQKSHRVQRGKANDGGNENDRQSPTFLANQIEQFGAGRANSCARRPNRAVLSDLTPMLDERKLLPLPHAKKEQQLANCLPDRDTDRNGNGPSHSRHLRGDDVRLGIDNRYDRGHDSEADRGEQSDELIRPDCSHLPTVPEAGRLLLDERSQVMQPGDLSSRNAGPPKRPITITRSLVSGVTTAVVSPHPGLQSASRSVRWVVSNGVNFAAISGVRSGASGVEKHGRGASSEISMRVAQ